MPVFVKAHRRGSSVVRSYTREKLQRVTRMATRRLDYANVSPKRRQQYSKLVNNLNGLEYFRGRVEALGRTQMTTTQRRREIKTLREIVYSNRRK